jgi:PAS domain S-box-containing protein
MSESIASNDHTNAPAALGDMAAREHSSDTSAQIPITTSASQPRSNAVKLAVAFGMTVWILVSLFGGLLLLAHYRETVRAADDRIKQISEQIARSSPKISAAQASALSASATGRLFLVSVMQTTQAEAMRPVDVGADVWRRWLQLPKTDNVAHHQDDYFFRWSEARANDGLPLWINVAQAEARALEAFYPLRNYTVGVWLTFSLGIIYATAILARTLLRRGRAEEALRLSELTLRAREADLVFAQSIAKFGSWRVNLVTGNIEPSAEYLALFEVTAQTCPRNFEEWIKRFLPETTEAEDARRKFKQACDGAVAYEGTRRVVLDSGRIKWLQFYARPVFDHKKRHVAFFGVARDVTVEHMAAEHLAASEERYRVISENMQDIVSLHTRQGAVLYASPSLYRLLGHKQERAIGNSPISYIHPDDQTIVMSAVGALVRNETQSIKIEYRIRGAGGRYVWFETLLDAVFHREGQLRHFQASSRDISARKVAESALAKRTEQLSAANRLLTREVERRQALERRVLLDIEMELAQVGLELHDDLGQDLTGVALLTKTLERKLSDAGLSAAEDAARISDLVNRAIRHTRMISHGLSPYVWGEYGLSAALAQLASDIDSLGTVSCIAKLDDNITIDDEVVIRSLYRIAQEATNNALKHSQARHIRIGLKRLTNHIQLVIADDGTTQASTTGRNHSSSNMRINGTDGTGLHSIRHRAQTIDANVKVRISPGRGTAILITLNNNKLGLYDSKSLAQDEQSSLSPSRATLSPFIQTGAIHEI